MLFVYEPSLFLQSIVQLESKRSWLGDITEMTSRWEQQIHVQLVRQCLCRSIGSKANAALRSRKAKF